MESTIDFALSAANLFLALHFKSTIAFNCSVAVFCFGMGIAAAIR